MNTKVLSALGVVVAALCGWLVVSVSSNAAMQNKDEVAVDQINTVIATNPVVEPEVDSASASAQVGPTEDELIEATVTVE